MSKTVPLFKIFVETVIQLFKLEILCNIINVTFYQFNVSLLNKRFKKDLTLYWYHTCCQPTFISVLVDIGFNCATLFLHLDYI